MLVHPTSFHAAFPSIIPVVARCSNFSLLITWPKKLDWSLHILFMLCQLLVTMFLLISLKSIRRNHISVASRFFLKLSRPPIHTSEWVQYSTPGLLSLCDQDALINSFLLALFLIQFHFCCIHHLIFKYQSI